MRDYSKVSPRYWTGDTGRQIRALGREAQVIAFYLFTCPHANMLGLYYLSLPTLCHETGIPLEPPSEGVRSPFKGARETLRSLENIGFAHYDEKTEHVYIPNMAREQIGERIKEKDNRHVSVLKELESLRKTPFFNDFVLRYRDAYRLHDVPLNKPLGSPSEGTPKPLARGSNGALSPLRSQEQEQEQEQKQEQDVCGTRARENALDGQNGRDPDPPPIDLTDAEHHQRFECVQSTYPRFSGRQDWINAESHCRNHVGNGDATWDALLAVADRYAKHIRAKGDEGTQFVKTPGRFFAGADADAYWRQEWPLPTPANGKSHQPSPPVKYRTADEIEAEERARGDYDAQH